MYVKKTFIKKNLMIFTVICIIISIFIYFLTQKYLVKPKKNVLQNNLYHLQPKD